MIDKVMNLFTGTTMVPAIVVAVAAFVLGMLAMCILCKLLCPCGKKGQAPAKCAAKAKQTVERPKAVHTPPADGSVEIYVGNLSYDVTEEQLNKAFSAFGKVDSARIITHKYTGKSKGFGFVHMPNRAEAEAAVKALADSDLGGRKIKCNEAKNTI